jgi:alpha-glucosidase
MNKIVLLTIALSFVFSIDSYSKDYELDSPEGKCKVIISVDKKDGINARLFYLGKEMMNIGPIGMEVEGMDPFGDSPRFRKANYREFDEVIHPVVREKRSEVRDNYKEIEIIFRDPFRVIFRAYDDGIAYRIKSDLEGDIKVVNEQSGFSFLEDAKVYYPTDESFFTHSERAYDFLDISAIGPDMMSSTPFLVEMKDGKSVLVTEVDLQDYPGMYVYGDTKQDLRFNVKFPHYVTKTVLNRDRDVKPVERAAYLAETDGNRFFPWRLAAFYSEEKEILGSDIVYRLSPDCRLDNTGWIKPGKVSWDWWNACNNKNVPFRSGVNTETYKYHIDFAADFGLDYIILDEGWSTPSDLFEINPDVNMAEICSYAEEKGVGIILWVLWNALDNDIDRALDQFARWGVKGIKVDFMQRDDQWMVNYYWRVSRAAAEREMLVDFHGAYKPAGLRRAYPNMITREGVKGLENNKWSREISPDHDCTLPFIRQFAGPMDYTPGAMRNAGRDDFHISFYRPVSQGTRAHQLALYVVFESPLQMLADAPSSYYEEPLSMEFLADVPVVWDETIPLFGKVSDYAGVARRSGNDWFIGAITDWDPREFNVDLVFMPEGEYEIIEFEDGINADRHAEDLKKEIRIINNTGSINIKMAPGGGYAAILRHKAEGRRQK